MQMSKWVLLEILTCMADNQRIFGFTNNRYYTSVEIFDE